MRHFICIAIILVSTSSWAQSQTEKQILALSRQIFHWETTNQIDSLEKVFDDQFVVVSSTGESQKKGQYIALLRSGNFVHNTIDVEENTVIVSANTATIIGKGKFTVTISQRKTTVHLSFIEVFSRVNSRSSWKVLAMHASGLSD